MRREDGAEGLGVCRMVLGCAVGCGRAHRALRSGNQLAALPESFGMLIRVTNFECEGNPFQQPPLAVCQRGVQAIAQYLQEISAQA